VCFRGGTTCTRECICFVQRSYFVKLLMNDVCRLNAFLMLNSMVQSIPFKPYDFVSIYTVNWKCHHVMG